MLNSNWTCLIHAIILFSYDIVCNNESSLAVTLIKRLLQTHRNTLALYFSVVHRCLL